MKNKNLTKLNKKYYKSLDEIEYWVNEIKKHIRLSADIKDDFKLVNPLKQQIDEFSSVLFEEFSVLHNLKTKINFETKNLDDLNKIETSVYEKIDDESDTNTKNDKYDFKPIFM